MHPADKAVLRLAIGLGLAVLVAYGTAIKVPFVACMMTVLLLCKPGPPMPLVKGLVVVVIVGGLLAAGMLMVPILEHYAVTGVMLTAVMLYAVYRAGARRANPLTMILVIAFAAIPVAGVAEQALAIGLAKAMAVGLGVGILVSGVSHAFFPDAPRPAGATATIPAPVNPEAAHRAALQATLVIMPVFVLALTNPALYLPAIMKSGALGQQAGSTDARSAGQELVGSTLVSALMAIAVWLGLSLSPTLWMLILWMMAAAFWAGRRLVRVRPSRWPPSFWGNALVTMLILLGPAIEDSAVVGKDVFAASVTRVTLFIAVAFYAWATVWIFDRWLAPRPDASSSSAGVRAS